MSVSPLRTWLFVHPDFDASDDTPGLRISAAGGMEMVEGKLGIRQALLLLLSTLPGERVMRPEYGCPLHRLVFSPNDETTAGLAIHYVRRAVERFETRVEILRLDAAQNPAKPEQLLITLDYRVLATNRSDRLQLALNLAGGGS